MTSLAQQPSLLLSLPPELILESLAQVDYTPGHLDQLRLVCRDFNDLLQQYEHSLSFEIIRLQCPLNILAKYPGLHAPGSSLGFKTLDELYMRFNTLFRIERNCHNIRRREGKEAAWMRPEWVNLQQAGMHLLYRIHDSKSHENKAQVIKSLPPTSLAILLLTLHLCVHQLRSDGPCILIPTSPLLHGMLRFEVELCTQELVLHHGPSYQDALLCHCPHAISFLETEVRNMETRQLPSEDGKVAQRTLIAECRCRLAETLGSDVEDNRKDMWSILERIGSLTEEDVVKVIRGEELITRKRQDSGVGL
ncbi:hypothetical protein D6C86_02593 [Aureobasidium pullulans]|uniref:F-box domain-containing protein n=1 Tax=Aureobasidium pullulans TaxID=5580 RepID=A0A4S9PXT7_AURPU|nr:hypothetical protein D6C94_04534 [Aureobasidium pullulans]THZ36508.1 hypothetical protein D6C87_09120 [Aureobasidium pullulans]THZ64483.1 hypothetical protein D6C86_02593 [Aureobasidium pullulans]THZ98421.1 hypothetical protein D6C88_00903 [Aureobasidium pullulans]